MTYNSTWKNNTLFDCWGTRSLRSPSKRMIMSFRINPWRLSNREAVYLKSSLWSENVWPLFATSIRMSFFTRGLDRVPFYIWLKAAENIFGGWDNLDVQSYETYCCTAEEKRRGKSARTARSDYAIPHFISVLCVQRSEFQAPIGCVYRPRIPDPSVSSVGISRPVIAAFQGRAHGNSDW